MKKYKLAVFIGRFQPVHNGHISVIREALDNADNLLMILGSSNQARTIKNPWTFEERQQMICKSLRQDEIGRIQFRKSQDWFYNEARWLSEIQQIVSDHHHVNKEVLLVGHQKDDSSYYLKSFPQWDYKECNNHNILNSTDIRNRLFSGNAPTLDQVHINSTNILNPNSDVIKHLKNEWNYIQEYKQMWETTPYPPIFVTVDAVVVQSGHVLVIERGDFPGKGLFAIPGGFLDQQEQLLPAMIRELREETGLKVPEQVIQGSIEQQQVFDHPGRSMRGRTITHAYFIQLKNDKELPRVKGQSDANKAFWMSFSDITTNRHKFFEDHYQILNAFLNI